MAHYAVLDENNIVLEVITGKDEDDGSGIDWEEHYSQIKGYVCKRTSYNTSAGVHLQGKEPFRKNMATIGGYYDPILDAFIPAKPFPSFVLNPITCTWDTPIPPPNDGLNYGWNEELGNWTLDPM